jgi:hypothetical protein
MKTTTRKQATSKKQTPPKPYHPAFGTIGLDVDLGIGILIAEGATSQYEILGPVATINEAIEIARRDYANRLDALEHMGDPMRPEVYKVWSRNCDGEYSIAFEIREGDAIL